MKKELINLAECLAQDQEFVEEFSKKKTVDEQYAFAQIKVKGYSKDEFIEFMKNLEEAYKLKNELSPEDLGAASGGSAGMAKLAALAMLGLTFAGGAMNMTTSLPTAAVNPVVMDAQSRFQSALIDEIGLYKYSNSSQNGVRRELLKSIFKENPSGCEVVINNMLTVNKGLKFNRHVPKFGIGRTYWSMELNLEDLPDVFVNGYDEAAQEQIKSVLLWMGGKYLYFNSDEDFQIQCSDGYFRQVNYELFKSEIKGNVTASEEAFNVTTRWVESLLNRDRALSGALRELGKTDLATKVMGNRDIDLSGVRDLETLFERSTFNYTNSSEGGSLRKKICDILLSSEENFTRPVVIKAFAEPYVEFTHHYHPVGLKNLFPYTSWSFDFKQPKTDLAKAHAIWSGNEVLEWLKGKELWYKNESELQVKVKDDDWKVVNYDNFLSYLKGRDSSLYAKWAALDVTEGRKKFNDNVKKLENELNKTRAIRGAIEKSGKLTHLLNTVMPEKK